MMNKGGGGKESGIGDFSFGGKNRFHDRGKNRPATQIIAECGKRKRGNVRSG